MQVNGIQNGQVAFKGGVFKVSKTIVDTATQVELKNLNRMSKALKDAGFTGDVIYLPGKNGTTKVIAREAESGRLYGTSLYGMLSNDCPDENLGGLVKMILGRPLNAVSRVVTGTRLLCTKFTNI